MAIAGAGNRFDFSFTFPLYNDVFQLKCCVDRLIPLLKAAERYRRFIINL